MSRQEGVDGSLSAPFPRRSFLGWLAGVFTAAWISPTADAKPPDAVGETFGETF